MNKLYSILLCLLIAGRVKAQCDFVAPGPNNIIQTSFSAGATSFTSMAVDSSGTPYMAYQDNANGNKATVMKYNGSSWVPVGAAGYLASSAQYTFLAIDSSGTPYVAYRDESNGGKATVMRFNGSSWTVVGTAGFSQGATSFISLAIDPGGTPYVAYGDSANGTNATVMKFNGTSWTVLGRAGFTPNNGHGVAATSLAIDKSGIPYLAVDIGLLGGWAIVEKYDNSTNTWVELGPYSNSFFSSSARYVSLAIDPGGTPYVAYQDASNDNKATVKKFNGSDSSWTVVGTGGFSQGGAAYTTLAIDASGTLYVGYRDESNGGKATVMKYNRSSWTVVGTGGFSQGIAFYTSMAVDSSGTPYMAYQDNANGNKATVMKYNGSSWVPVGAAGFSQGGVAYTSLALNSSGTPYIAYIGGGVWVQELGEGLATTNNSQTTTITPPFFGLFKNGCSIIATVKPGSTNGVSGSTSAKVWIESSQPTEFVKRHYEITPASNANTATGRITLYFTQADFDGFNAINNTKLPTGNNDGSGKANLRIEKRSGTSNNGTGLPNTYTGTITTIDPADADIVWNATQSRWEVSFNVTGFSGFFVKTTSNVLPLQWLNVNVNLNSKKQAVVNWKVNETEVAHYTVEKSANGINFTDISDINSRGDGENSYTYLDATGLNGTVYYRIKQVDKDGKYTYSPIIKLNAQASAIAIYPIPFKDGFTLTISRAQTAIITNVQGQIIRNLQLNAGSNYIEAATLSRGIYVLKMADGTIEKLAKE